MSRSAPGCHRRFDTIGLTFEGYGPIGERRDRDLGGHPVDARATFPDGSEGAGLDGFADISPSGAGTSSSRTSAASCSPMHSAGA